MVGFKSMAGAVFSSFLLKIRISCPGRVLGCLLGCFLEAFEHPLGHLGTPLGTLWDALGSLWTPFGSPWDHFGTTLAPMGRFWVPLEVNFARIYNLFDILGPKIIQGIKKATFLKVLGCISSSPSSSSASVKIGSRSIVDQFKIDSRSARDRLDIDSVLIRVSRSIQD